MSKPTTTSVRVISLIAPSLKKRAAAKAKKNHLTISQVIREFLQSYVRK